MSDSNDVEAKTFRILNVITFALLVASPAIYLFIGWFLDSQGVEAKAGNDLLVYILLVLALVQPALAPLVTRMQIEQYRKVSPPVGTPAGLFQTLSIIRMAFIEAIYIYGLVSFLVTGRFKDMLYFYPIGVIWSFVYWPRRSKYEQLKQTLSQP